MTCAGDNSKDASGPKAASWRDLPVQKRLAHALVKGIDEFAVRVCVLARSLTHWARQLGGCGVLR